MLQAVPTLLLQCDQDGASTKAIPGGAVVPHLKILCQSLGEHQRGQDTMVTADCLHRVTPGRTRGQAHVSKGPDLCRGTRRDTRGC